MRKKNRKQPRKWRARKAARFNDAQAQKIGERLEKIAERLGIPYVELSVGQIFKDAHVKSSALRPRLEWDDLTAADLYRKTQIRHVMNHLDIEFTDSKGQVQRMKAFFNVRMTNVDEELSEETPNIEYDEDVDEGDSTQRVYVDIEGLKENEAYRLDYVAYCEEKLNYWAEMVRRVGVEKTFKKILKAIDEHEAAKKKKAVKKKPKKKPKKKKGKKKKR